MKNQSWTYRLILAIIAIVLLNTLTVYEVSKWTVMSHHAKVWLDKKDGEPSQKKLCFLDNKILTKKDNSSLQKTNIDTDTNFLKNLVTNFILPKKNNIVSFLSFQQSTHHIHQNRYLGITWKTFFGNCIVAKAP